jgi:hypothetical protein
MNIFNLKIYFFIKKRINKLFYYYTLLLEKGGIAFIGIKGMFKIYYKQQQFLRQAHRQIKNYEQSSLSNSNQLFASYSPAGVTSSTIETSVPASTSTNNTALAPQSNSLPSSIASTSTQTVENSMQHHSNLNNGVTNSRRFRHESNSASINIATSNLINNNLNNTTNNNQTTTPKRNGIQIRTAAANESCNTFSPSLRSSPTASTSIESNSSSCNNEPISSGGYNINSSRVSGFMFNDDECHSNVSNQPQTDKKNPSKNFN